MKDSALSGCGQNILRCSYDDRAADILDENQVLVYHVYRGSIKFVWTQCKAVNRVSIEQMWTEYTEV